MLRSILASSEDIANDVSEEMNDWWIDTLGEEQRRDYQSATDALREGDQIVLNNHVLILEGGCLRIPEH